MEINILKSNLNLIKYTYFDKLLVKSGIRWIKSFRISYTIFTLETYNLTKNEIIIILNFKNVKL